MTQGFKELSLQAEDFWKYSYWVIKIFSLLGNNTIPVCGNNTLELHMNFTVN